MLGSVRSAAWSRPIGVSFGGPQYTASECCRSTDQCRDHGISIHYNNAEDSLACPCMRRGIHLGNEPTRFPLPTIILRTDPVIAARRGEYEARQNNKKKRSSKVQCESVSIYLEASHAKRTRVCVFACQNRPGQGVGSSPSRRLVVVRVSSWDDEAGCQGALRHERHGERP